TWSLRARLLVALVSLLAVVCVGIGVGTELALHRFLMGQLDEQVIDAGHRSAVITELGPPPPPPPGYPRRPPIFDPENGPGPVFLGAPGQATGTVGAVAIGGQPLIAGVISQNGTRENISAGAAAKLARLTPNGRPMTIDLDELGRYRVVARYSRTGKTIVSGLPMASVDNTLLSVGVIFAIVAGTALLAAIAVGIVIIRRQLAPVSRVSAAALQVANLDLERGDVRLAPMVAVDPAAAHTEVGQLATAVNRMLERISAALAVRHASEMRVRQFVADASHELRTPLTAIRGYTELAQRRRDDVPAEVAHAMGRVESEAVRMTHLVEDLLLLARLDTGRPLERDPVDLSQLVIDAVADAHVAGPDHQWSLDLPDEPVIVTGDGPRLQQVLVNLLANARTHTPAGTSVKTSLAGDGNGAAVLTVTDNGPGIPDSLRPEIFERFARGDTSRSRREGSTGLGLAIVSAVIKAHHGTIDVHSTPGDTAFVVHLPRSQQPYSHDKSDA
ncbi:MAG: two-component system, OmpR family, sensor kinase, partial [Mycobacterium sp.]|nr:two-component system, OmpR family, sensor kinase [Mycobacterium sp.]